MPASIVKTKEDERLWKKAKKLADEQGRKEDWNYVMGIFMRMKGRNKKPWEMTKKEFIAIIEPSITKLKLLKRYVRETGKKIDTPEQMKNVRRRFPREFAIAEENEKRKIGIYKSIPKTIKENFKINQLSASTHKNFVAQALLEGKSVPAEVLADYPELKRHPRRGHLGPRKKCA